MANQDTNSDIQTTKKNKHSEIKQDVVIPVLVEPLLPDVTLVPVLEKSDINMIVSENHIVVRNIIGGDKYVVNRTGLLLSDTNKMYYFELSHEVNDNMKYDLEFLDQYSIKFIDGKTICVVPNYNKFIMFTIKINK